MATREYEQPQKAQVHHAAWAAWGSYVKENPDNLSTALLLSPEVRRVFMEGYLRGLYEDAQVLA